jgi:hypothetical protein
MVQAAFPFALPRPTLLPARPAAAALAGSIPTPTLTPTLTTTVPTTEPAAAAPDVTGFQIGWDHARHGLTPPLAHLQAASPVRQGWGSGRAAFGGRQHAADAAVNDWLALRLEAWHQGCAFESLQVTPRFLAQLQAPECPVLRQPVEPQENKAARPTALMRLDANAAYAAGNLVMVDAAVARARQGADCSALLAQAQRVADNGPGATSRGLDAQAWLRLAVLASFGSALPHGSAATLPLVVLPPARLRVINPVQALQVVLTLQFTQAGYARRLLAWAALMPGSEARQAFQIFMHTLLARRLAAGQGLDAPALKRAMEDSWRDTLVQRRWQRLALWLSAADCEQLLQRGHRRGLNVGGARWISAEIATDGWQADGQTPQTEGLAPAAPAAPAAPVALRPAMTGTPNEVGSGLRPVAQAGMASARRVAASIARKRGSQKLAS